MKRLPSCGRRIPRQTWTIAAVVLAAAAVRFVYLIQIRDFPFFTVPQVDAKTYLDQATEVAAGGWMGKEAFWQPPLYPYLLGMAVKALGVRPVALHALHLLLGAVNCGLIALLGMRVFGRGPGLVAGLIAALYGPFVFFEGEYLPPVLSVFLNLCLLLLLLRAKQAPAWPNAAAVGALFGLSALARPDILLFLPVAALWLLWVWRTDLRRPAIALRLGLILAAAAATVAPATVHNYIASRQLIPISFNGGINFYIGNNARWRETVAIRPTLAWGDLMAEPLRAGQSTPAGHSAYFMRKAWADVRAAPAAEAGRLVTKFFQFFAGYEYPRNLDLYAYRDASSLLALLMWKRGLAFPYGLLVPLALAGLLVLRDRRAPEAILLIVYLLACAVATALFFVAARYRIPAVPALILFAANLPFWVRQQVRERRRTPLIAAGLIALTALVLANRDLAHAPAPPPGEIHLFLGHAYSDLERWPEAAAEFRKAAELSPEVPDSYLRLAFVHRRLNERSAERACLRQALVHAPPQSTAAAWAHRYLGDWALRSGDLAEARREYERSLEACPFVTEARLRLATIMIADGERAGARRHLQLLIANLPRDARPYSELARLELAEGHRERAIRLLERALSLDPRNRADAALLGSLRP